MKRITIALVGLLSVASVTYAQSECESMLDAANKYYNEGRYEAAAKMYEQIHEDCSSNYSDIEAKLKDCKRMIKEDVDFGNCTSISACDHYLGNYPDGRYVAEVKQKRDRMIKAIANAAEDDKAFQDCVTEDDFLGYMKQYPYGRHVAQAKAVLAQFEEERVYENCYTESDYNEYMKRYPNGKYSSEAKEKLQEFEEERLRKEREAAKTAYMRVKGIDFANTRASGTIVDEYGATLYLDEIQYLTPRLSYDGLLDENRLITIYCKFIRPDGTLVRKPESPSGYSFSHILNVYGGHDNEYELPAWGGDRDGYDDAGTYKFELWFDGSRVYQTTFVVVDKETPLSRGKWRTALERCGDHVSSRLDEGSFYKGQYYNYRRSGLGMYSWKGVSYYIGNWDSGKREGMGMEIEPSGCGPDCEYYVGEYASNMKSGKGACYDKYGNLIYLGDFADDWPTQEYPMPGYDSYKFECIAYSRGDYYVGETYNGKPNGIGIYIWSNGDLWYGRYFDGQRDGYGIFMSYQGEFSTGIWKGDTRQ